MQHGPRGFQGPVRGSQSWWRGTEATPDASQPAEAPPNNSNDDPTIRHELVARVRQEIAAGIYDTEEKWEKALERLSEEI